MLSLQAKNENNFLIIIQVTKIILEKNVTQLCMMVQTSYTSTWEAEAGGLGVSGQPGLQNESLSHSPHLRKKGNTSRCSSLK
jgi:hypothetical protein